MSNCAQHFVFEQMSNCAQHFVFEHRYCELVMFVSWFSYHCCFISYMRRPYYFLHVISAMARTNLQTSRGHSSFFFALNHFGTRFGCTYPLTALRLYKVTCCIVHHCRRSPRQKWKCLKECIGRSCGQYKDSQQDVQKMECSRWLVQNKH